MTSLNNNSVDLDSYIYFADNVMAKFSNLSKEMLNKPIADGKWNPRQLLHHIVDSEIVYYQRIKRTLTEDKPVLRGWDQPAWVNMEDNDLRFDTDISIIRNIRNKLFAVLQSIPNDSWTRGASHPKYGELDLAGLIRQQIKHSQGHLDQIAEN